jgi:hypothetical protein
MDKIRILICCGGGFSSSYMMKKVQNRSEPVLFPRRRALHVIPEDSLLPPLSSGIFFELKHFQFLLKNKGAEALDHFCPFAAYEYTNCNIPVCSLPPYFYTYFRYSLKNASIFSNGITFLLSYRSV